MSAFIYLFTCVSKYVLFLEVSKRENRSEECYSLEESFGKEVLALSAGLECQFGTRPLRFNGVVSTLVVPKQGRELEQEVQSLLAKGAIERIHFPERDSRFYSWYLIVPKKDGGLSPIIDLQHLNRPLRRFRFKMLAILLIVSQIKCKDWFVMIDLKDAYFNISVLPQHRKFLISAFGAKVTSIEFFRSALALSPGSFIKCMDAALGPLRLEGIRVLNYINDWLILAQFQEMETRHRDVVLTHIRCMGL